MLRGFNVTHGRLCTETQGLNYLIGPFHYLGNWPKEAGAYIFRKGFKPLMDIVPMKLMFWRLGTRITLHIDSNRTGKPKGIHSASHFWSDDSLKFTSNYLFGYSITLQTEAMVWWLDVTFRPKVPDCSWWGPSCCKPTILNSFCL